MILIRKSKKIEVTFGNLELLFMLLDSILYIKFYLEYLFLEGRIPKSNQESLTKFAILGTQPAITIHNEVKLILGLICF